MLAILIVVHYCEEPIIGPEHSGGGILELAVREKQSSTDSQQFSDVLGQHVGFDVDSVSRLQKAECRHG